MKPEKYRLQTLKTVFGQHKIAPLYQLKKALGNPSDRTVFRKLEDLQYISSYSHRGKYYTLKSIARFNADGLWTCQSVWFSRFGNLLDTAEAFVDKSEVGYSATELKDILRVKTQAVLPQLVRCERLQRDRMDSIYVYFSADDDVARPQRKARKVRSKQSAAELIVANPDLATDEAKAVIILFYSMLDERQRRLYAGLESLKLGYGGDAHIASLLGINPHTVARGRQELMSGEVADDRVRTEGGGRLPQGKKHLKS